MLPSTLDFNDITQLIQFTEKYQGNTQLRITYTVMTWKKAIVSKEPQKV